jgi:anti-sigma B factor antagonist
MPGLITTTSDDIQILDFEETRILDQETVDSIGGELQAIAEATDVKKIVIDLNRIELMTSTMIGQFVTFHNRCRDREIELRFCNLSSEIQNLFKITRLDSLFQIAETREKAIESLNSR